MIILGIETSCDETACAVLKKEGDSIQILSNVVASSATLQAKYGGIIPEQAAREQLRSIIPVIQEVLTLAFNPNSVSRISNFKFLISNFISKIDAIAVTSGPGLIGSLLVGVETAKTLALVWNKPLIPVNHLLGHFYANWIENKYTVESIAYKGKKQKNNPSILDTLYTIPKFPSVGLLVSGGHTDLVLFTDHGKYKYLGGTRDDAAGECFDKCARLLGLPYPGGPEIAKLAQKGNPKAFDLPRPMMENGHFSAKGGPAYGWDFSFSGLKTAVVNLLHTSEVEKSSYTSEVKHNLAASIEQAIVDVLVNKTIKAAKMHNVKNIMVAGGVAANKKLSEQFLKTINDKRLAMNLFIPPPPLCTDNAAMIAAAGFFLPHGKAGQKATIDPLKLQADPNLALD